MQKLIADSHYDIGGFRDVYEDRVGTRHMETAGGMKLVVAVVADGVGGENAGERAAQTALDAFFSYLEKSRQTEIPSMLRDAVTFANKAVFQLQKETRGSTTTLTVAVVEENSAKLFIANVGDSRVYLCRNNKLTQLTRDHSFANVMQWRGQISAEAARTHPRAGVLMRAIGAKEQVEVDLGFYVGTTDYEEANAQGIEGLPLQEGDGVLVCSDGLIKDSPKTHELLIKPEEIIRTLHDKEGKKAAQELVSFSLGRGPDDNISAAIIQMPDRMRAWRARRPAIIAGASILLLLIGLIVVINALGKSQGDVQVLAQQQTGTSARLATIANFTKTPTSIFTLTLTPTVPTPTPTLRPPEANQAARVEPKGEVLHVGDVFTAPAEGARLDIYHTDKIANGFLQVLSGSRLTFDYVNTDKDNISQIILRMEPGSQAFLYSGGYNQAKLILTALNVTFYFQGFFAIDYTASPPGATAHCYSGACSYTSPAASGQVKLEEGKQLQFDSAGALVGEVQPILVSDASLWKSLLPAGSPSYDIANRYVPTPTPTPSVTHTLLPTKERTATNSPAPVEQPTATPQPTATATSNIPTATKKPTSTFTQKPPPTSTNTPVPAVESPPP